MGKRLKMLKDQRGLTLIELLAVIVILGIIAAIAIPAIGGLINGSKKDAFAANAVQMINSAKLFVSARGLDPANGTLYISLQDLYNDNQIEKMKNPFGSTDITPGSANATAATPQPTTAITAGSFVKITYDSSTNQSTYTVTLTDGTNNISGKTLEQINANKRGVVTTTTATPTT